MHCRLARDGMYLSDLAISPDGRLVALILNGGEFFGIREFRNGNLSRQNRRQYKEIFYCASFSRDGHYLATAGVNKLCIWKVESRELALLLETHPAYFPGYLKGMRIGGARGLDQNVKDELDRQQETMLEFLAANGAILDQEQKVLLEKIMQKNRSKQSAARSDTSRSSSSRKKTQSKKKL